MILLHLIKSVLMYYSIVEAAECVSHCCKGREDGVLKSALLRPGQRTRSQDSCGIYGPGEVVVYADSGELKYFK